MILATPRAREHNTALDATEAFAMVRARLGCFGDLPLLGGEVSGGV